jgi:hypothetical protein
MKKIISLALLALVLFFTDASAQNLDGVQIASITFDSNGAPFTLLSAAILRNFDAGTFVEQNLVLACIGPEAEIPLARYERQERSSVTFTTAKPFLLEQQSHTVFFFEPSPPIGAVTCSLMPFFNSIIPHKYNLQAGSAYNASLVRLQ